MFSSFKNEPNAEEVIGNNSADRGKYIAERKVKSKNIFFPGEKLRQCDTKQLEG